MSGFGKYCDAVSRNLSRLTSIEATVEKAIAICCAALSSGRKIMFCGNGGSAADSQHLAAELMGRFLTDRKPLPAIALTVDTSALTAIANDYGYDSVFSRQLQGLGVAGDVLFAISTSGNSGNVVAALRMARRLGIASIALTGGNGGIASDLSDVCITVPSSGTNHIQELHLVLGHYICGELERKLSAAEGVMPVNGSALHAVG